jgi:signal transduction histidine kinase
MVHQKLFLNSVPIPYFSLSTPMQPSIAPLHNTPVNFNPPVINLWFSHDLTGRFISFYSDDASGLNQQVHQIVGSRETSLFRPERFEAYQQVLDRVVLSRQAEHLEWAFLWNGTTVKTQITLSAIVGPDEQVQSIFVQGRGEFLPLLAVPSGLDVADRYHLLLTQISWSIRRTLDLKTIWQQTVDGLGTTLTIDRCSIYSLNEAAGLVTIEAEFCSAAQESWQGRDELLKNQPTLRAAITRLRPSPLLDEPHPVMELEEDDDDRCVVTDHVEIDGVPHTRMVVATGYQDEVNGLIVLWRSESAGWNDSELDFLEELADQVGTAIAHAELFNKSEQLNKSLVRKQEDLEEAISRAEEASRLKSEFLANTSHELRTPLNGMIGFLKLILDGMADDPEEQQEFLEESLKSAEHLLDIINDVLDLAKIEAGKLQIEYSPVDLGEVLDQLQRSQANSASRKNLTFEIQIPQTRDAVILYTNYKRLYQVLLNLVGNAIKFTHEGGVTITTEFIRRKVTIQNHECPGIMMLRVADTGIGVSLEKQDRLFQSFSQIDGSTTRRYGGTGLGLAISQTLVNAMGGEVNFYSMGEGLGSTVTFTIPLFQEPIA